MKRLDPGNKCLNYDFCEELRQDTEAKERLEKEKEERKKERERKKAEKEELKAEKAKQKAEKANQKVKKVNTRQSASNKIVKKAISTANKKSVRIDKPKG